MKRVLVGASVGVIAGLFLAGAVSVAQNIGGGGPGLPLAPGSGGTGSSSNTGALNWTGALTFTDTTGQSFALPATSDTLAGLAQTQTWTGVNTFPGLTIATGDTIGCTACFGADIYFNGFGSTGTSGAIQFAGGGFSGDYYLLGIGSGTAFSASSGAHGDLSLAGTVTDTGTAGWTQLLINPTLTSLGSGSNYAINVFPNGGSQEFFVDWSGNVLAAGNETINGAPIAGGSTPTLTGTCTTSTQAGGKTAGSFHATCTAQTVIIALPTAPNGWTCEAFDETTSADTLKQTSHSASSCTLTGTTAAADNVVFTARAW